MDKSDIETVLNLTRMIGGEVKKINSLASDSSARVKSVVDPKKIFAFKEPEKIPMNLTTGDGKPIDIIPPSAILEAKPPPQISSVSSEAIVTELKKLNEKMDVLISLIKESQTVTPVDPSVFGLKNVDLGPEMGV